MEDLSCEPANVDVDAVVDAIPDFSMIDYSTDLVGRSLRFSSFA